MARKRLAVRHIPDDVKNPPQAQMPVGPAPKKQATYGIAIALVLLLGVGCPQRVMGVGCEQPYQLPYGRGS
jgi:hypothetical protein